MKIKSNSDDDLPLKKTLELRNIVIVVRSAFQGVAYITLKFSYMNGCINYKFYKMIGLMCLKELMLIRQAHQKNVTFVTIGIF